MTLSLPFMLQGTMLSYCCCCFWFCGERDVLSSTANNNSPHRPHQQPAALWVAVDQGASKVHGSMAGAPPDLRNSVPPAAPAPGVWVAVDRVVRGGRRVVLCGRHLPPPHTKPTEDLSSMNQTFFILFLYLHEYCFW